MRIENKRVIHCEEKAFIRKSDGEPGKRFKIVLEGDGSYSGFGDLPEGIVEGSYVSFDYDVNGLYNNVKGIVTVSGGDIILDTSNEEVVGATPVGGVNGSKKVNVIHIIDGDFDLGVGIAEVFEGEVNKFSKDHKVAATQTHVFVKDGKLHFVAVQYYE